MADALITLEDRFLAYFDRIVLCRYRSRPDLFLVSEDDMGGEIEATVIYSLEGAATSPYFRVRFGFRQLSDGRVCVAAFGPDLKSLPEAEQFAWAADQVGSPSFSSGDEAFERWSQRYLHGSWESENGPLRNIEDEIELIQAMTRFEFQDPLFKEVHNPALRYPIAENSESLTLAKLELARLVIDGLSLDVLKCLSKRLTTELSVNPKTLSSLKQILPEQLHPCIHKPLRILWDERCRIHGVPSKSAHACAAFSQFHSLSQEIHVSVLRLRKWLEDKLCLSAAKCLEREQVMERFPSFHGPIRPAFKLDKLRMAEGKTIGSIDAGEVVPGKGCHSREAVIIHFTDGTQLAIDMGSNAGNLEADHDGLKASMFSVDMIPMWAPNPKGE